MEIPLGGPGGGRVFPLVAGAGTGAPFDAPFDAAAVGAGRGLKSASAWYL